MAVSRSDFIRLTTFASATFLPVIKTLAKVVGKEGEEEEFLRNFNKSHEFHLADRNLLNLHFYFINARLSGTHLKPENGAPSFMIVRLPQLHVSERGFWEGNLAASVIAEASATLSGYSYLAFQLWPLGESTAGRKGGHNTPKEKKLPFTLDTILDWNNQQALKLITLVEWFHLKGVPDELVFADLVGNCIDFKKRKIWNCNNRLEEFYYKYTTDEPSTAGYRKYKSIISTLLDQNLPKQDKPGNFIPVSFFEMPQGLCLVPVMRDASGGLATGPMQPQWKFWKNDVIGQGDTHDGSRRYEIWNNTLNYRRQITDSDAKPGQVQFKIEAPSFRAIGLISDVTEICSGEYKCEQQTDGTRNTLPTLLDKSELAFLTQYAKDTSGGSTGTTDLRDFTAADFDIKELNGIFFTGLGVITHLKYYNVDKRPPCIDLIEYEHIITEGRDIFVKVARLGYNVKTGQKYKHVIEAKRRISEHITAPGAGKAFAAEPTSFLELKMYCESIDKTIDYLSFLDNIDEPRTTDTDGKPILHWKEEIDRAPFRLMSDFNITSNDIIAPALDDNLTHHYRRFPFKSLTVQEKKRIPVKCLQNDKVLEPKVCDAENLLWFWPVIEDRALTGTPDKSLPLEAYLPCDYVANDWENNTIAASTPFMFIRASLLECKSDGNHCAPKFIKSAGVPSELEDALQNYFKGEIIDGKVTEGHQVFFDRRKTFLKKQFVAFAPSLKDENAINTTDASKSKVNIIETEFIDTFFLVRSPLYQDNCLPAQKIRYIIFPQLLRFQGYTDHVRDLTYRRIPQMLEHHENYINYKYKIKTGLKSATGSELGNHGSLILAHTDAFMARDVERLINGAKVTIIRPVEEIVYAKYGEIKTALSAAKDKLGNLVVPAIIPDTISLEKLGITLPKDINESIERGSTILETAQGLLNKIKSLNPREFLRGKLSDVCGLDLTAILDELLPAENTPFFEINKTLGELEEAVQKSDAYKAITDFKIKDPLPPNDELSPAALIKRYEDSIRDLRNEIEQYRQQLNATIRSLAGLMPDSGELDILVKNSFEQLYSHALEMAVQSKPFQDIYRFLNDAAAGGRSLLQQAETFIDEEVTLLYQEIETRRDELQKVFDDVRGQLITPELSALWADPAVASLRQKIEELVTAASGSVLDTALAMYNDFMANGSAKKTYHDERFRLLFGASTEENFPDVGGIGPMINTATYALEPANPAKAGAQLHIAQLKDATAAGTLQLEKKIEDLVLLVTKNVNGNAFQQKVAGELQKLIGAYQHELKMRMASLEQDATYRIATITNRLQEWQQQFDDLYRTALQKGLAGQADAVVVHVKSLINRFLSYVDFLRRLDPWFYYQQQQRLVKEITDIEKRFHDTWYQEYLKAKGTIDIAVAQVTSGRKAVLKVFAGIKTYPPNPAQRKQLAEAWENFKDIRTLAIDAINKVGPNIIEGLRSSSEYKEALKLYDQANNFKADILHFEKQLQYYLDHYKQMLQQQAEGYAKKFDQQVKDYIDRQEDALIEAVGAENILTIEQRIQEAKNIYRLITSVKQQELSYSWSTTHFRDINLGIVAFKKYSAPDTTLKVDVKATVYFSAGKFPPVPERVVTYSENRFTNFGVSFFNAVTVNFTEVSFTAGSDSGTHFNVRIKDVQFDGALSFVQAFESWLQTLGKGLILQLRPDHVALGYSLQIPDIKAAAFSFFNLSLNFDLRVFFDSRPLSFGFSLATADKKFGIAAGIYAGFGFFGFVVNTKQGVEMIEAALEAGAWAGISIGPIKGEVKLAFGFYFRKNQSGVRIEGYIVAEGRLSVWIIEVSARIYLGIISENSSVDGQCTVTYSAKLGFVSKSFSGTFHKHIAGANSNNSGAQRAKRLERDSRYLAMASSTKLDFSAKMTDCNKAIERLSNKEDVDETMPVTLNHWRTFVNTF